MAQPAVTVRIATVQEEDWRREAARGPVETLRDRLKAQTVVELHGGTVQGRKLTLRSGREQPVVTQYSFERGGEDIVAAETSQEWIGTQVMVNADSFMDGAEDEPLDIEITHDIAEPDSTPYHCATAAKGAEHDRHTVPLPRFQRLHWKGVIPPDTAERAIASFPLENTPGSRMVVFFQGGEAPRAPTYNISQTIYRVPEMEMIELLLAKPVDDEAIVAHLEKARAAGRASIVSDVSIMAGQMLMGSLQAGAEHHVPTEMNPDYDTLFQVPDAFEVLPAGTKLEFRGDPRQADKDQKEPTAVQAPDPQDPFSQRGSSVSDSFSWNSWFGSPAPLAVTWPTSWLRIYDHVKDQSTDKVITGFMDWHDRFAQTILTNVRLPDNTPRIVAMMPPADQAWGATRKGRWLDVTVARCQNSAAKPAAKPATKLPLPWLVLGISLDSRAALKLLEQRGGKDDSELLRQLMQRVKEGTAHVRVCTASAFNSSGHTLSSTREHAYPTEMPSIPSAWSSMLIGTYLQADCYEMYLSQDLAPPARQEWKLSLHVPEAVMWEPSRRVITTRCAPPRHSGTHLCSAAAVPAILAGPDMPAGETLLILMHREEELDPDYVSEKPHAEIEALIFEVPVAHAGTWQAVKPGDFAAFTAGEMDAGRAKLSGHALHQQRQGSQAKLSLVEEQMTATEFDGPNKKSAGQMRPTGLEVLNVGTTLETDCSPDVFEPGVGLNLELRHSIARPFEPGLAELLKITDSGEKGAPGATHLFSEWLEQLQHLKPNEIRCLGVRGLPGNAKSVHIAYLRVREAK